MQPKSLLSPTWAVSTLFALFGGVSLAAILTQYPGLIELKFGESGLTIDGRSISERFTLPPYRGSQ